MSSYLLLQRRRGDNDTPSPSSWTKQGVCVSYGQSLITCKTFLALLAPVNILYVPASEGQPTSLLLTHTHIWELISLSVRTHWSYKSTTSFTIRKVSALLRVHLYSDCFWSRCFHNSCWIADLEGAGCGSLRARLAVSKSLKWAKPNMCWSVPEYSLTYTSLSPFVKFCKSSSQRQRFIF